MNGIWAILTPEQGSDVRFCYVLYEFYSNACCVYFPISESKVFISNDSVGICNYVYHMVQHKSSQSNIDVPIWFYGVFICDPRYYYCK